MSECISVSKEKAGIKICLSTVREGWGSGGGGGAGKLGLGLLASKVCPR